METILGKTPAIFNGNPLLELFSHMEPRMQNQQESVQKALADSETRMQNTQNKELTEKDSWKTSNFGKILRDHSYRIGNFMQIIWTVSVDNCIHTFDDYIW